MKKSLEIWLLVVFIGFTSCIVEDNEKDDNDENHKEIIKASGNLSIIDFLGKEFIIDYNSVYNRMLLMPESGSTHSHSDRCWGEIYLYDNDE